VDGTLATTIVAAPTVSVGSPTDSSEDIPDGSSCKDRLGELTTSAVSVPAGRMNNVSNRVPKASKDATPAGVTVTGCTSAAGSLTVSWDEIPSGEIVMTP